MEKLSNYSGNGCSIAAVPDARVFVDVELDRKFREDGYVVLPLLGTDEVQQLDRLHNRFLPELGADFFTTAYIADPEIRFAAACEIDRILQPRVQPLLCGYKPAANNFVSKRANTRGGKKHAHQDYSFVDQTRCTSVHLWVPLVDVDEHNGSLIVYPGTHSLVNHISATLPRPGTSNYASPYAPVLALLEEQGGISMPLSAGSAIFLTSAPSMLQAKMRRLESGWQWLLPIYQRTSRCASTPQA